MENRYKVLIADDDAHISELQSFVYGKRRI